MCVQTPNARAIFERALEFATDADRQAFLEEFCAGRPAVRENVQALLRAHADAGSFLSKPALQPDPTHDFDHLAERPGTIIGPYKLLEQIGEGGFGVVFMAEQERPVSRRVALKVIKPGMDTRQVIARFEAERQALALMDHPNIAKVLEAGATESGRPYFVMELVRGIPITQFCDRNCLTVPERLELFMTVCHAVQHAHQKGIIHRDIKPTNVLVTLHDGQPVAKVIDFGVAKATGQRLTDRTLFTAFAQMVGTPLYMSPEQAEMSGLDVDTRSDIYSLGVMLYELLTGTTPFDKARMNEAAYDEVRRIICHQEPPKPSTRISTLGQAATTISTQRKSEPDKLRRLVRGDLDWIVMKCLEKDRARRYDTANDLAADLKRHLKNEPVIARPPSTAYRLRKAWQRNKVAYSAATAVAAVLLVGLSVSLWLTATAIRAQHDLDGQRLDAQRERDNANQARRDERRLNFQMAFDRGLALCDDGHVGSGMLWLARALELAPPEEAAAQRVIRANLTAWRRELHTLQAIYPYHKGAAAGAMSPDGMLVLTGGADGLVQLWDRRTLTVRRTLHHEQELHEILFSPAADSFLTASIDETARLWDKNTGRLIHTFRHGSAVWGALFTVDGSRIITSDSHGEIQAWDVGTGERIDGWEHPAHASVHDISLSADGKQIVGAGDDGSLLVWDVETHEVVARFVGHAGRVPTAVFVGPNRVASADTDGNVCLWTWHEGKGNVNGELISKSRPHRGGVHRLRVSESGNQLLTASYDNTAQLLSCETGEPIGPPFEHQGGVKSVAFGKDGSILTFCEDIGAREWRPARGSLVSRPLVQDAGAEQALYTPDAKYVLMRKGKAALILNALTGEPVGRPFEPTGIHAFAISSDESTVITGADNGSVQFWKADTGLPFGDTSRHSAGVWAVAISEDGEQAVSGGLDGVVKLWDARTGRLLNKNVLSLKNTAIRGVVFSPDRSQIAVASEDKLARLVATDGRNVRPLEGHDGSVMTVAFSCDNREVATGSWDKTVRVWDAQTGIPMSKPMLHRGPFWYAIAFSRDGQALVAGCDDHSARIWDVATAKPIGPRLPHDAALRAAYFTEDDAQITTGTSSGTTYIWEVSRSPLEAKVEQIKLWLQVSTGMELGEDGDIHALDPDAWQQRRKRLDDFGGTPSD